MGTVRVIERRGNEAEHESGAIGTREYDWDGVQRAPVSGSVDDSITVPADCYELCLVPTADCYISLSETTLTDENGMPLFAGAPFHLRVQPAQVIQVLQISAGGYLFAVPCL